MVRFYLLKVVHHRCQAIAFIFNGGSCGSFTFDPIDTTICRVLVHYLQGVQKDTDSGSEIALILIIHSYCRKNEQIH